ncbi:MAG: hypothetical protein Q9218_005152, partial [Villophora microphyllina]
PRADICDPNDCTGDFHGGDDPYFDCPNKAARVRRILLREILVSHPPQQTLLNNNNIADFLTSISQQPATKREASPIVIPPPPIIPLKISCQNCAKIKSAKAKFNGKCDPADSTGYSSSHNCKGNSPALRSSTRRMESAFLKELACVGILDEISNIEDGEAIGRYVRHAGGIGGGGQQQVQKVCLFVVYQSGREGPQNGFRLALVKKGVTVEAAVEQLKNDVPQDTTEYIIVE